MKKYIIPILAAGLALMASCQKQAAIDPLKGDFAPASDVTVTSLTSCDIVKGEGVRTFNLKFSGGGDVTLALVGNKYFLPANTYTAAAKDVAKNGNYILTETKVNGKDMVSGSIIVGKSGDDKTYSSEDVYSLSGMLFDEGGSAYKVVWSGTLAFEPDPEPVALTQVFTAQSNLPNGVNSVTLSLGSADISNTFDPNTFQTTWSGSGNYLAIDLYSADGYLHEGVYTASAVGGTINEGEFGIGYDTEMWGMTFYNWGTCWWTVDNGTTSAEKITSGTISVEKKGAKWVITWGDETTYPKWARFEGAIEALTPAGGDQYDGVTLTQILGTSDYTGYGINLAAIELGTDGITVTPGAWGNTYGGDGNYLKLELYSTDGKIAPGTYKACAVGGTVGEGEFGIGYDGQWGASDTTWYTLVGGEATYQYITDGTVTVEVDGDNYKISIESSVIKARFGYPAGGGDEFVGIILSQFCGASDYTGYGINLAGVELATDGITVTPGAWGNTYGGDGNYIKLEFYSTDGTLAPGEYKACAVGGNVGEGEFGIGYDGQWGASGTTWYTLVGGEASYVYITDGTLKVEKDGDVYTIVLLSSVTNIKYVGKLAAE